MVTLKLLQALSKKAGQCSRLQQEKVGLQEDLYDVVLRYNRLQEAYSKLLNECMKTEAIRG